MYKKYNITENNIKNKIYNLKHIYGKYVYLSSNTEKKISYTVIIKDLYTYLNHHIENITNETQKNIIISMIDLDYIEEKNNLNSSIIHNVKKEIPYKHLMYYASFKYYATIKNYTESLNKLEEYNISDKYFILLPIQEKILNMMEKK